MKKTKRILTVLFLASLLVSTLCVPAFALTKSEVQAQVSATSREAVTGNVLIWFLCAVAFLKVSQKIDSFMASLGVNVGHTGGSLLAEAMIAMRTVTMVVGGGRGAMSGRAGSAPGQSGGSGMAGFFRGGLIGMAGRHITNSAVKTATTQTSAVRTAQSQTYQATSAAAAGQVHDANINSEVPTGGPTDSSFTAGAPLQDGVIADGSAPVASMENIMPDSSPLDGMPAGPQGSTVNTASQHDGQTVFRPAVSSERGRSSHSPVSGASVPTLGGLVFSHSLAAGGSFANGVIGKVARGEVGGSITGDMAAQSLQSYLGYTEQGSPPPVFTDAEIGRGRITGQVSTPEHPQPIAFGLYHTEQYAEPKGEFTKIRSADGALWYSQLAQDTVERKPYTAPDGTVAYKERIVKKLPDPPKRKDRI